MKPVSIAADIVAPADFKAHASRLLRRPRRERRPAILTGNGKPAAVSITPEELDRIEERNRFLAAVREDLAALRAGRPIDDEDLDTELDAELGPLGE